MATDKKIAEATQCILNAEKSLKTGLFKWRPDYDNAASEYSRAATCFKAAKSMDQSKNCLLKAADCFMQNNSFFSAAKSYEQAALVCRDIKDMSQAGDLIQKACHLFQQHGSPDTAALSLERGAKMIEGSMPERALKLLQRAADVVMLEDRPRQAAEYTSKVSRIFVKLQRYDEAAISLRKEIELLLSVDNERAAGRQVVALVLVHLARDDIVAANKAFQEGSSHLDGEELDTINTLMEGYDQSDPEQCIRALSSPFIKHMDVEYAKLARCVPIPSSSEVSTSNGVPDASKHEAPKAAVLGDDVDEEYAGGLC